MEWTDEGIVLGVRRHGESSAIVELLTRKHGRHLGLVRGGAGWRMRPLLQPGNSVRAGWRGGRPELHPLLYDRRARLRSPPAVPAPDHARRGAAQGVTAGLPPQTRPTSGH